MPQFYQIKGQPTIYSDPELTKPFSTEEEFIAAGGTPYWRPDFTGVSNVQMIEPNLGKERPTESNLPTVYEEVLKEAQKLANLTIPDYATSYDREADIQKNLRTQLDAQKKLIEAAAEKRIAEEEEKGRFELGGETAKAMRFAGGLGLDTATAGYIKGVQADIDKRINKLKEARDEALRTADIKYLDLINESMRREEENRWKINEAMVNRALQLLGVMVQEKTLEESKRQFEIGETRAKEQWEIEKKLKTHEYTEKQQKDALDEITRMAQAGYSLDNISPEKRTELEVKAGLESGTFEAFYKKIQKEYQTGKELDALKIEQMKADIAKAKAEAWKAYQEKPKEEKSFLTNADYLYFADPAHNVPAVVADAIAIALSEGQSLDAIRNGLAKIYGQDQAFKWVDIAIPYFQEKSKKEQTSFFGKFTPQ